MVVRFLRRRLKIKESESVFCYLHNCWSPGLDESVGELWNVSLLLCFWSSKLGQVGERVLIKLS